MPTPKQYLNNLKNLRATILDVQAQAVEKLENEIIRRNFTNIQDHIASDGGLLVSSKPKIFDGTYSLVTQMSNPLKIAGTPYDFVQTGDFASNFVVDLDSSLTKIIIYSTGSGSGDKKDFFDSYKKLYGLPQKDQLWLRNEIMKALQIQARKFI